MFVSGHRTADASVLVRERRVRAFPENGAGRAVTVIARVSVPAEAFPLGEVLEVRCGVRVRLESLIPTGAARVPYFWVPSGDADDVAAALREASLVDDARVVDEVEGETLFRVAWSTEVNGLLDAIEQSEGVVLEGTGQGEDWSFRLRFPDRARLSRFYRRCIDEDIPFDLKEVHEPTGQDRGEFGLTDEQHEALVTALETGYYDVPRRITLVELADRLGISDTAASQRIRRGLASLLSTTLGNDATDVEGDETGNGNEERNGRDDRYRRS